MSDDQKPFTSGSHADMDENETGAQSGGKLIGEDVFLARLAERRKAEEAAAADSAPVIDALLGALESIGFDPTTVAPEAVQRAREAIPFAPTTPDSATSSGALEDMALEHFLLDQLRDGSPLLGQRLRDNPAERSALFYLAGRLNPGELGAEPPDATLAPADERAMREGVDAGTQRALRDIARLPAQPRRSRANPRRVAEERPKYGAKKDKDKDKE